MNKNKTNNSDKKKLFILILLLFVVIGVTGYGAYSYFYTSGSYSGNEEIDIASFNPEIDGDFLGDGGSLTLTCPESATGNEVVNCTGTLDVVNNGNTPITLSTSNASVSLNNLSHDDVSSSAGTPTFSWSDATVSEGNTSTLTVTVPVTLSSHFGSSDGYSRDTAYAGEAIEVRVSFKITATQVYN
ncbi:MAG: hypothetical protein IKE73_04345 [Bacilli bacterium]|nr:hypothetical protein [Bacilli bacterium]